MKCEKCGYPAILEESGTPKRYRCHKCGAFVEIFENHVWKWYDAKGNRFEAKPIDDDDLVIETIEKEIENLKRKSK